MPCMVVTGLFGWSNASPLQLIPGRHKAASGQRHVPDLGADAAALN
jgi:hypothetical protein